MNLLIAVYILRVGIIDVFYSVSSCRIFLNHDLDDYLDFETYKAWLGDISDVLDFITALTILYLFRHYLRKQYLAQMHVST